MNDYTVRFSDRPDWRGGLYSLLPLIEREMEHYQYDFEGKTVFCDCCEDVGNDFFKYFLGKFRELKIKKLTGVCYLPVEGVERLRPYIVEVNETRTLKINQDGGVEDFLKVQKGLMKNKKNAMFLCETGYYEPGKKQGKVNLFNMFLDGRINYNRKKYQNVFTEADIVFANAPDQLFPEYMTMFVKNNKPFVAFCTGITLEDNGRTRKKFADVHRGFVSAHFWSADAFPPMLDFPQFRDENGDRWTWWGPAMFISNLPDVSGNPLLLDVYEDYSSFVSRWSIDHDIEF